MSFVKFVKEPRTWTCKKMSVAYVSIGRNCSINFNVSAKREFDTLLSAERVDLYYNADTKQIAIGVGSTWQLTSQAKNKTCRISCAQFLKVNSIIHRARCTLHEQVIEGECMLVLTPQEKP